MNEHILALVVSNVVIAFVLAMVALAVQAKARRPWLAHLAWLLVLVKLVTPPMMSAPVFVIDAEPVDAQAAVLPRPSERGWETPTFELSAMWEATRPSPEPFAAALTSLRSHGLTMLAWIWIMGSAVVFCVSSMRIVRFEHRLRRASKEADPRITAMATRVSRQVGLRRTPNVRVVHADVAPLVWWSGGTARIVLPASMVARLNSNALRVVVAHELAHVVRGDHLVRWLEWLANVLFWWCPVLWIARRGLRQTEELSCDALVVERLRVTPHSYANSILDAIELLAAPAVRPPVLASQMTSGGALEERLTMIVSNPTSSSPSRRARVSVLLVAASVLPFGIAHAQVPDYDAVGNRLMKAVDSGELSVAQAKAMFGALAARHFEEALAARNQETRETEGSVTRGIGRGGFNPTDTTTESDPLVDISEPSLDDVTNRQRDPLLRSYGAALRFAEEPTDRNPATTDDASAYDKSHSRYSTRDWLRIRRKALGQGALSDSPKEEALDLPQRMKTLGAIYDEHARGEPTDLGDQLSAWGQESRRDADHPRALLERVLAELESDGADQRLVERLRTEIELIGASDTSDPVAVEPEGIESAGNDYGAETEGGLRR